MIGRWFSREDAFVYAYLVMALGCIYFVFNYIERVPFSDKAGESVLFRLCWLGLYAMLLVEIARNANVFVFMISRSALLWLFFAVVVLSLIYNGADFGSFLKSSMYLITILFAGWVAASYPIDRFVRVLYVINITMLVLHAVIYPIVGSTIDYDPLHRATILGTEPYAGVFGHKNLAGWFFAIMAFLSFDGILEGRGKRPLLMVIVLVCDLIALAGTGAAGPLIGIVVTFVVFFGAYLLISGSQTVASVYCLAVGFVVLIFFSVPTEDLLELLGRTSGLTGRSFLWSMWPHFFWQRPLMGYGFNGFFTSLLDAPSTELTRMAPWNTAYYSFENSYLEALLEFGIIGGLVYALLICRALWQSVRFAFGTTSRYRLVPFGLLVFVLVSSTNDNNLLLHNYFACVVLFWCYFGIEAPEVEASSDAAQLRMRHV